MFFVSYAAYYPNKVRAQNTNRVPVQKQYLLGPQLFFARFPQLVSVLVYLLAVAIIPRSYF